MISLGRKLDMISERVVAKLRKFDITFYLQAYNDFQRAEKCLTQLRSVFPKAKVILITDGDDSPEYEQLNRFGIRLIRGERLYPINNGGKMIHRFLDCFAESPSDYLIKIDTDTLLARQFRYLPQGKCLFGCIQKPPSRYLPSIQGGFVGFTREAALDLHSSKIFLETWIAEEHATTWAISPFLQKEIERTNLIRFEWLLCYGAILRCIPLVNFEEVMSAWRTYPSNENLKYAAIHPYRFPETL